MIRSFITNVIKRESLAKALPFAKKILLGAGKIYVQGAAKTAGESAINSFVKAPKKVEDYVNKKKGEFLDEAESKAEKFMASQMEILDQRIDQKIVEVENKVDEKIRALFWLFLVSTFAIMIIAGLTFSLIFRYFDL